ncbi:MAG: hypothetical protein LBE91_21795 [Tannerella sp.]|jgi:hypothetical protein|nr:hypothetical protein [Tannerella sp.]
MKRDFITILTVAVLTLTTICTVKGQSVIIMETDQKNVNFSLSGSGKVTIDWGEGKPKKSTVGKNTKFKHKYKSNTKRTITITGNYIAELDCSHNTLIGLDVSNNTELVNLYCYGNKLTYLDVSNNKVLRELDCSQNTLTSLDVSQNPLLTTLDCIGLALTSLDVSKNTELVILRCHMNQLTDLDLSNNKVLKILNCRNNQLSDIALNEILKSLPINEEGIKLGPDFDIINRENVPEYCIDNNPGTAGCDESIMDHKGWLRVKIR